MLSHRLFVILAIAVSGIARSACADDSPRYLALQIFTPTPSSAAMRPAFPPAPPDLGETVRDLRDRIGSTGAGARRLGVLLGPIAFDNDDDDVRRRIEEGFDVALATGVAIGFHLDDSMFWGRLSGLNTPETIEWLDWHGTPNTGRRLDWSSKPIKIMPQLCLNSPAVKTAVTERAGLIGRQIAKGVERLRVAGQDALFIGVIAGWETQIGRDFATGQSLGYCALAHAGYSADHPPDDLDRARSAIVASFIGFWAKALVDSGVPPGKVFSHIAYRSMAADRIMHRVNPTATVVPYLQSVNFSPPETGFCPDCIAGLSTYPQPGHLEQWQEELAKRGNPPWVSSEGTAIDPGEAERSGHGMSMEGYLGNLFNHGAVLVNVFGWGVGAADNPFRKIAENPAALAAYRKFLSGAALDEAPIPVPVIPPADLPDKIHTVQAKLPGWIEKNGPAAVKDTFAALGRAVRDKRFDDAETAANTLLEIMGQ
jgi:hypothetical protein